MLTNIWSMTFVFYAFSCVLLSSTGRATADERRLPTVGSVSDPTKILPLFQGLADENQIRRMIMPPILQIQKDGRVTCYICREAPDIELRRNEQKGESELVVSLVLKKKLEWGDGQDLTREDVKFTLETMATANYPEKNDHFLPIRLIEFDKEQGNKMRLILRHLRSDALQLLSVSLLPKHKEELIKKLLSNPNDSVAILSALKDPAFSYGPYKVTEVTPQTLDLKPASINDWDLASDALRVKFFANIRDLALSLASGDLDQTLNNELTWTQYLEMKKLLGTNLQKFQPIFRSSDTLEVIVLNLRSPVLVNPAIRQAVLHAIDRDKLNQEHFEGGAQPANSILQAEVIKRLGEKTPNVYDPKLSQSLLEQAGWKLKPDGYRYGDGQQKLTLTLACTPERLENNWFSLIQNNLKSIGIELHLELLAEADYQRQTLGHRRFRDAACLKWNLPPLSAPLQIMHSLAIPSSENDYNGSNYSGWDQSLINKLLEKMITEHEPAHALRLYSRIDKQFASDVPAIPLVFIPRITLLRKVGPDSNVSTIQKELANFHDLGRRKL